jgi:hypothetical protein
MGVLKAYSISSEVDGGEVLISKLHTEIEDSGHINGFECVIESSDDLKVAGESFSSESGCDTIVKDHVTYTLTEKKDAKKAEINTKTWSIAKDTLVFEDTGTSLKTDVDNATTIEEIDAITDER